MFVKIVLFLFFLPTVIFAEQNVYVKYSKYPEKVYQNQIFSITIKTTVLNENFESIYYKFTRGERIKQLTFKPEREIIDEDGIVSAHDKFYFQAQANSSDLTIRLPKIKIYNKSSPKNNGLVGVLRHKTLPVIELPKSKEFANIIAENIDIYRIIADRYDKTRIMITMFIRAKYGDLSTIHFDNPVISDQQKLNEKIHGDFRESEIKYYIVIPKYYEEFNFKYFNSKNGRFETINFEINVRNDTVVTAENLKPKEMDKNRKLKIILSGIALVLFLLLFYYYMYNIFLVFASIFFFISIMLIIPKPSICVESGTSVRILPMDKSTIFKTILNKQYFEKIAERNSYIKISIPESQDGELSEGSEGWIRVQDICKEQ